MTEVLFQDRRFNIQPATLDDVVGIGEAQLQSWLETYPNEEYGVTKEWIKNEFSFLVRDGQNDEGKDNGIPFRTKVIEKLDENVLYEVVKDESGIVQGFMHVERTDGIVSLNAIYLTNALKGTGVARKLMEQAIAFAGNLPMQLQVVVYNERAINFYEKYGFVKGEIDPGWFHGKMPVLGMRREGKAMQ